jgi:NADH-quinone oxidoreductase subunit N
VLLAALTGPVSLLAIAPELLLIAAGCAVLIMGLGGRLVRDAIAWVTLAALIGALVLLQTTAEWVDPGFRSGLEFNNLAHFVRMSALIVGIIITAVAWMQPRDEERGEFFSMLLFTLTGLLLVGASANLFVLFLALEILSIPSYILVAISRGGPRALESGTKYFYLGALSAAITAYGFSFLYGVTGSATLDGESMRRLMEALRGHESTGVDATAFGLATVGLVLSIGGLLFKIAAFPLHFYIADVYQGAASSIAGMLGFVPKLAGMVAIIKIVALTGWQTTSTGLFWMLWIVSAVSMTYGNVLALRQSNIKRMLAYSGVAHSGYMLIGILVGPQQSAVMGDGAAAVLFYAVIYGIANLGAFALLGLLKVRGQPCETVRDVTGLLRTQPGLAMLMALAMLALMGLPPTSGFWGKLSLFGGGMALVADLSGPRQMWLLILVIIAALNSAIAAAYYLRVVAAVLLYEAEETAEPAEREGQYMGAMICGFLTLAFTFYPSVLLNATHEATRSLRANRGEVQVVRPLVESRAAASVPRD